MDLNRLRHVYDQDGPFATVYLEGRSPGEDAGEQIRLRWRALRERLVSGGATTPVLEALDAELRSGVAGEEQADGRVLVASKAGVLLHEPWDAALGTGDDARWTPVPELGAYAREAARSVRMLVVISDAHGARIRRELLAEQHEPQQLSSLNIAGSGVGRVLKPHGGALSHRQIHRQAEEALERNAKDIVDSTRKAAANFRPHVIVLAGEVQSRTAVRQQLTDDIAGLVTEAEHGGRDEPTADEALHDELLTMAGDQAARRSARYTDQFNAALKRGRAVQSHEQVAEAAESGAVDTLLFESGVPGSHEGSLLKLCAQTSSEFGVVTEDTGLTDGVGAILRFPPPQ